MACFLLGVCRPVEYAAWALCKMAKSGFEIAPWGKRKVVDYLPNMAIVYYPWSKPDDCRMKIMGQYITVRHIPEMSEWFKIGINWTIEEFKYIKIDTLEGGNGFWLD